MTTNFQPVIDQALEAMRDGHLAEGIALLREAAVLQPESSVPHFLMGANLAGAGFSDQAEAAYIRCLARTPDNAPARFQLGLLQLTCARGAAAEATWEALLQSDSDGPWQQFALGLQALQAGRKGDARQLIERGIALNTDNEPMNRDMQGVLGRIRHDEDRDRMAPDAAPTGSGIDLPTTSADASHFLLSSYRQ